MSQWLDWSTIALFEYIFYYLAYLVQNSSVILSCVLIDFKILIVLLRDWCFYYVCNDLIRALKGLDDYLVWEMASHSSFELLVAIIVARNAFDFQYLLMAV